MALGTHRKVSGTWEEMTEVHRKISGTWEEITEIHRKVSGTWEQVFGAIGVVSIDNQNLFAVEASPSSTSINYKFFTTGLAQYFKNGGSGLSLGDNWWSLHSVAGIGNSYEVMATQTGTTGSSSDSGDVRGSWLALTSDREWGISKASVGVATQTLSIEIGLIGTSTALFSATITLNLELV